MAIVAVYCLCHVVVSLQDEDPTWVSSYPSTGCKIFGFWGKVAVVATQQMTVSERQRWNGLSFPFVCRFSNHQDFIYHTTIYSAFWYVHSTLSKLVT